MTPGTRVAAMLVGLVGILFALAGAVREVVLASDETLSWRTSAALRRLIEEPYWATWVAAAAAAALAVGLIVVALRQLRATDGGPLLIQFQDETGWARLDVRAMERGMSRRLQAALPGVRVRELQLRKTGDVWQVTVSAAVPARDLQGLRQRAHQLLSDDLQRTGGMRLQRLDLVVDGLESLR